MPRFSRIQHLRLEPVSKIKVELKNNLYGTPTWWNAMLTHPPLPRPPFRRFKPQLVTFPEEVFKKNYEKKNPPQYAPLVPDQDHPMDGFIRRMIPKDNRWYKNPSEIFALRQLDYHYKGYSHKESYELVMKEFAQKRLELEIEKDIASRQMATNGLPRKSAFELLEEIRIKESRTAFAIERRERLEDLMSKKKIHIKNGISHRITPKDMSPADADFYLEAHPYDRSYFDTEAFLKYQVGGYDATAAETEPESSSQMSAEEIGDYVESATANYDSTVKGLDEKMLLSYFVK
eukprot:TRINITY_DN1511_c0_g1_i2.p1 TRINITY_DN1511_c0_g1~~TRINITY_DN1511_c0_g1_i2.p1  ORF type:complete len:290 (-),score=46.82 TRINITY_DN1511_c0_g1_i2:70-939(-)